MLDCCVWTSHETFRDLNIACRKNRREIRQHLQCSKCYISLSLFLDFFAPTLNPFKKACFLLAGWRKILSSWNFQRPLHYGKNLKFRWFNILWKKFYRKVLKTQKSFMVASISPKFSLNNFWKCFSDFQKSF